MVYNFYLGRLASTLSEMLGRSVSEFEPQTFSLHEIEGNSDKISYIKTDKDGNMQRLGFYMKYYKVRTWLKSPSLHIDFCDNRQQLNNQMRATNSQFVTYYSKEDGTKYENQRLKICKKCLNIVRERTSINIAGESWDEFLLSVEESEEFRCRVPNADGYAINWNQISAAYKRLKGYSCENCEFKLNDLHKTKFIQTHHIKSFEKLNNIRTNLKCLCVKCHSEVDNYHKQQFSTIENQILLSEFEEFKRKQ